MMTFIGTLILISGFLVFIKLFGLVDKSGKVVELAKDAGSVIRDANLDDYQKEKAMQKNAIKLLTLFILITLSGFAALAIPLAFLCLMEYVNFLKVDKVIEMSLSIEFIAAAIILSIVFFWITRKKNKSTRINRYSIIEKFLHHSAFNSLSLQLSLATIESRIYKNKLKNIEIKKPVFITALPRAGTTLLLELCVGTKEFISHIYSDMPFLMTPIFWNLFSKQFRLSTPLRERAHGDGMMINVDSSEAFEEIIWKRFWPSRYKNDRILPWAEPNYPEFEFFFRDHIRKIIYLRNSKIPHPVRYISKNNLNISRVGYLKRVFSDAIIIVPFRSPMQHAASLLHQHLNFQKIHTEDTFACTYMKDIGHFDFGRNLRPVDFNKWFSSQQYRLDPNTITFWLQYWIVTYKYLIKNIRKNIHFFPYDSFCSNPQNYLDQFCGLIEIKNRDYLINKADTIIAPKKHIFDISGIKPEILNEANVLYTELQTASITSQ